jgi:hypothetical protein
MATKTYTVRVAEGAPNVNTVQVAEWLDACLASPTQLAADPGAGERSLRLSLDKHSVEQGARAAGEPEATFLRRLIATNVQLPEEKEEVKEEKPHPKPLVLKGPGKIRPDQMIVVVRAFEAGQSFLIRKSLQVSHVAEAADAAAYTTEEREDVATAAAEVVNRRAPAVVVENIDIIGLATTLIAIETEKIDRVRAIAESVRRQPVNETRQAQPTPSEQGEGPR